MKSHLSDIEIAQRTELKPITEIARKLNINDEEIECFGCTKAKISLKIFERLKEKPDGQVILVTSINPTPAGEGKSTVTVGLSQALWQIGKKSIVAMREPSLGPTMGLKGGAAGGGYSQVLPMEDINLHFTGDMHAITAANNALAAFIDNHIHQGNELNIDIRKIVWKRALDLNDRALRETVVGLGGKANGFPREDGFDITVASEIMAVLCLARDLADLKKRLASMIVAYTVDGQPVTAGMLGVQGALALLLKDAIKPNLVQTVEGTPALVHGGPFANIAHGANSLIATKTAAKLADYVVTEAGFGGGKIHAHQNESRRVHTGGGRDRRHRQSAENAWRNASRRFEAKRPGSIKKGNCQPCEAYRNDRCLRSSIRCGCQQIRTGHGGRA